MKFHNRRGYRNKLGDQIHKEVDKCMKRILTKYCKTSADAIEIVFITTQSTWAQYYSCHGNLLHPKLNKKRNK